MEVFATKFGKPLAGAKVKLVPCNSYLDEGGQPLVGQPALDVNPDINVTNDDGIANFTFVANDPQNNRHILMDNCILFCTRSMVQKHATTLI